MAFWIYSNQDCIFISSPSPDSDPRFCSRNTKEFQAKNSKTIDRKKVRKSYYRRKKQKSRDPKQIKRTPLKMQLAPINCCVTRKEKKIFSSFLPNFFSLLFSTIFFGFFFLFPPKPFGGNHSNHISILPPDILESGSSQEFLLSVSGQPKLIKKVTKVKDKKCIISRVKYFKMVIWSFFFK